MFGFNYIVNCALKLSTCWFRTPVSARRYRASVFLLDSLSYFSVKQMNSFIESKLQIKIVDRKRLETRSTLYQKLPTGPSPILFPQNCSVSVPAQLLAREIAIVFMSQMCIFVIVCCYILSAILLYFLLRCIFRSHLTFAYFSLTLRTEECHILHAFWWIF